MKSELLIHPIPPVYSRASHTLILGSFPSPESRRRAFFYGNLQNRFWRVLAAVYSRPVPDSVAEKRALVLSCGLALWDVVASCEIAGASDSTIKRVLPNDIDALISNTSVKRVFCNGQKAGALYARFVLPKTGLPAVQLPSTSPANASWSLERLIEAWREALLSE